MDLLYIQLPGAYMSHDNEERPQTNDLPVIVIFFYFTIYRYVYNAVTLECDYIGFFSLSVYNAYAHDRSFSRFTCLRALQPLIQVEQNMGSLQQMGCSELGVRKNYDVISDFLSANTKTVVVTWNS